MVGECHLLHDLENDDRRNSFFNKLNNNLPLRPRTTNRVALSSPAIVGGKLFGQLFLVYIFCLRGHLGFKSNVIKSTRKDKLNHHDGAPVVLK